MTEKELRRKFDQQRYNAKARGVVWCLTYEQWRQWWGTDVERRGTGHDQLQMQRVGDVGPYSLDNIRKGYPRDNARTRGKTARHRNGVEAAAKVRAQATATYHDDEDYNEASEIEREMMLGYAVPSYY